MANGNKMKQCKHCGAEIAAGAKVCPQCGGKNAKPIFLRPWFLALAVIVVVIVISSSTGNDSSSSGNSASKNTSSGETQTQTQTQPPASKQPEPAQTELTPYDYYQRISENMTVGDDLYYALNSKAATFLKDNPELFSTTSETACEHKCNLNISFAGIEKNADKFGDELMYLPMAYAVQVEETEINEGLYLTTLNLIDDDGYQYYVIYLGELNDIYKESIVKVYGLPLGMSHFANTDGGTTLCPVLAGSYVEKYE